MFVSNNDIIYLTESPNSSSSYITSSSMSSQSTSSVTSEVSSDFIEVERIIEEYFVKKLTKSHRISNGNLAMKTRLLNKSEVSEYPLKCEKRYKKKFILKSNSFNFSSIHGIWIYNINLESYINEIDINHELNKLFQLSYNVIPKLIPRTFSENDDTYLYFIPYGKFNELFFQQFNLKLLLNLNQFSPLKAVFLVDKLTSEVILMNNKAKSLFKLNNLKTTLYLDSFLINIYKNITLWDYYVDIKGKIGLLPSKMVLCKDVVKCHILNSIRIQKLDTRNILDNNLSNKIMVIMEPIKFNEASCIINNGSFYGYDANFQNIFGLHESQNENKFCENSKLLFSSKLIINNLDLTSRNKKPSHNILMTDNNIPLLLLSRKILITSLEARYFAQLQNLRKKVFNKDHFYLYSMWYYNNLTEVITVSLSGEIIDCDPYFSILLGYSTAILKNKNIKRILKFDSIDFDQISLLKSSFKRYEAQLLHCSGNSIKCVVWTTKLENLNGENIAVMWILKDFSRILNFTGIHSKITSECLFDWKSLIINFDLNDKYRNLCTLEVKKSLSFPEFYVYNKYQVVENSLTFFLNPNSKKQNNTSTTDKKIGINWDTFYIHYKVGNIIGKGAFGFVHLVKSLTNGKEFVVKFIRKSKLSTDNVIKVPIPDLNNYVCKSISVNSLKILRNIKNSHLKDEKCVLIPKEIWMLCNLNHKNIVSLYDWYESFDHFQMIMPKHGVGMDLFEFIDRSSVLNEDLASYLFRQLVDAVVYLHNLMIAHRDIKDENIILDNQFNIKLIDFGAAVKVKSNEKFKTFCGTMEFCSPEILLGKEYDCFNADMWSMGITLYTIMFGENPFYDFEETINAKLKLPKIISYDLKEMLSMLLDPNPFKRVSAKNLLKHPWIIQNVDITIYSFENIVKNPEFSGNVASDHRKHSNESNSDFLLNFQ